MKGSLSKAAHQYVEEQHQLDAWNFLESHLTEEVLDEFFERYCSKTVVYSLTQPGDQVNLHCRYNRSTK